MDKESNYEAYKDLNIIEENISAVRQALNIKKYDLARPIADEILEYADELAETLTENEK